MLPDGKLLLVVAGIERHAIKSWKSWFRYFETLIMKTAKLSIVFAATFLLWACTQNPSVDNGTNSNPAKSAASPQAEASPATELLVMGKKLYMDNCAACHKESGAGGKMEFEGKSIKPDDLTTAKIKTFSDDKIIGYIYKGIEDEGMPAFKDKLSEAEIREVVRYVRGGIQKLPVAETSKPQ